VNVRTPVRATRTYTQRLAGNVGTVFPLLCPVRECDWVEGWDPREVFTASGLAERECVFTTPEGEGEAIWYVTRHEKSEGLIEMVKILPGVTACKVDIRLRPAPEGCEAEVSYSHTSLGPRGDEFVASFTEEYFRGFMVEWETQLNHYLRHGRMLRGESHTSPRA